jgi:hypothetical protein
LNIIASIFKPSGTLTQQGRQEMRRTVFKCLLAQSPLTVVSEPALACSRSLRLLRPFSSSSRATEGDR